jgi:hypothetical protein
MVLKVAGAMMASMGGPAERSRGVSGSRCSLRTGWPVSSSSWAPSIIFMALGVATTRTVQPSAWASVTSLWTSGAGLWWRPPGELLRGEGFGGAQGFVGLVELAPLDEGASEVEEQAGLALAHVDGVEVDALGEVHCGACVAEQYRSGDPVLEHVRRSERGPLVVAVVPESVSCVFGLVEELVARAWVGVFGGGDRTS